MKKYDVIYADPPWCYNQKSVGRGNKSGAVDKYKLMTMQEIADMPLNELTEDNAVCFMWCTVPLLPEAISTLQSWGFRYKTMITWEKTGLLGMGNWLRTQTEHILIGIKGAVKPFNHQERNIYKHQICDHSAKPDFFRKLVTALACKSFAEPKKLELFARSRSGMFPDIEYEGWDVYGNQVNNSIELPKILKSLSPSNPRTDMTFKSGTVTFQIGQKSIIRRYMNMGQRTAIIHNSMAMRLDGQQCYYTIRPDKYKYQPVNVRAKLGYAETCSIALANQIRLLFHPFIFSQAALAKLFGVKIYIVVRIINNTIFSPTK